MSVPDQPIITSQLTVLSTSSVSIQFNLVGNGGSDFTNIEYARSIDGYTAWTSFASVPPALEGTTSGTIGGLSTPPYGSFKIRSRNTVGVSSESDPQTAISSYPPPSEINWLTLNNTYFLTVSCKSSGQYISGITGNYTFLASSDYGQTFQETLTGISYMSSFAVTSTGQTIYVGRYDGSLYRSTDYGATFSSITTGYDGPQILAMTTSSNGTYIYAILQSVSTIIVSGDSGATWTAQGSMYVGWTAITCSSSGAYVYATGTDGSSGERVMYISTDYGGSWNIVTSFTTDPYFDLNIVSCDSTGQYAVVTAGTDGIYRSANYGSTWSRINGNSGGAIGVNWVSIASDASGANLIATENTHNCVYNSTDSGATWTVLNMNIGLGNVYNRITIDPSGTYRIVDRYINQFSSSATSPWSLTNNKYFKKVKIASDNLHMAAVEYNPFDFNKIAISTDGGANWTSTFSPDNASVTDVAASLNGQNVYYRTEYPNIYVSTDYGASFSVLSSAPYNIMSITCDSAGTTIFVGIMDGSIYKSSDSGANFTQVHSGTSQITSITCSASGRYVYAIELNYPVQVLYSQDYGNLNSFVNINVPIYSIICDSTGQKLLGGGDGLYSSIDYGMTWRLISFEYTSVGGISCDSLGNRVFICSDGVYYQSLNAGSTWTPITPLGGSGQYGIGDIGTSISPDGTTSLICCLNPGTFRKTAGTADVEPVWTGINDVYYWHAAISTNNQNMVSLSYNANDNTQRVAYSSDSGVTWNEAADMGYLYALGASASCQYVLTGNDDYPTSPYLHYSTDYGQTFTELSNSAPAFYTYRGIAVSPSGTTLIAIGQIDEGPYFSCLVSTNSGANWTETYQFSSYEYIETLDYSQTLDRLYVVNWDTNTIMTSVDVGQTWNSLTSFTSSQIRSVACDWTGRYVVAACSDDGVYRSTDYGDTWSKTTVPSYVVDNTVGYLYEVRSNSTGSRIIALTNNCVYVSQDSGATWTTLSTPGGSTSGPGYWGTAISPDGTRTILCLATPGTFFNTYGTADLPAVPCFLEGTKILCKVNGEEKYVAVETIRPGMLVKTCRDGYKAVKLIGHRAMDNPGTAARDKNSLYLCSKSAYPELTEDLTITGCHAILVDQVTDVHRRGIIKTLERIFVTDKKYRLPACVDERATVVQTAGTFTVWHFALEHYDVKMNYGVYAQGLLVESSPIWHMNLKNYTLV